MARGWHVGGILRLWEGEPDIAIEHIDAALRLSPRARVGTSLAVIGAAHFFRQSLDEAMQNLLIEMQKAPTTQQKYKYIPQ